MNKKLLVYCNIFWWGFLFGMDQKSSTYPSIQSQNFSSSETFPAPLLLSQILIVDVTNQPIPLNKPASPVPPSISRHFRTNKSVDPSPYRGRMEWLFNQSVIKVHKNNIDGKKRSQSACVPSVSNKDVDILDPVQEEKRNLWQEKPYFPLPSSGDDGSDDDLNDILYNGG